MDYNTKYKLSSTERWKYSTKYNQFSTQRLEYNTKYQQCSTQRWKYSQNIKYAVQKDKNDLVRIIVTILKDFGPLKAAQNLSNVKIRFRHFMAPIFKILIYFSDF